MLYRQLCFTPLSLQRLQRDFEESVLSLGVVLYSYFQEGLSLGIISLVCFHDLAVEIQVSSLLVVLAMVACLLTLKGFWSFGLDRHRIEFL